MKSIVTIKNLSIGKITIFIAAAIISTIPVITSLEANGQRDVTEANGQRDVASTVGQGEPWFCDSKILKDAPEGNKLGWNPNAKWNTFSIQDDCYYQDDSIVILNVNDGSGGAYACNVDYMFNNRPAFEVYCTEAPSNGSELHYTILVDDKEVIAEEETIAEIPKRQQNSTQQ